MKPIVLYARLRNAIKPNIMRTHDVKVKLGDWVAIDFVAEDSGKQTLSSLHGMGPTMECIAKDETNLTTKH